MAPDVVHFADNASQPIGAIRVCLPVFRVDPRDIGACDGRSQMRAEPGRWARPAKSLVNVQRGFALGLAEILGKHIAEQSALLDGVVEGDVGMGM